MGGHTGFTRRPLHWQPSLCLALATVRIWSSQHWLAAWQVAALLAEISRQVCGPWQEQNNMLWNWGALAYPCISLHILAHRLLMTCFCSHARGAALWVTTPGRSFYPRFAGVRPSRISVTAAHLMGWVPTKCEHVYEAFCGNCWSHSPGGVPPPPRPSPERQDGRCVAPPLPLPSETLSAACGHWGRLCSFDRRGRAGKAAHQCSI